MSSFHAGSSALSVSALASNSANNSARTRKRKASCVARAAAGVPGCSKRYCQNVAAHWRPGYFSSVSLLPALRNCSVSSRACLLSVLMRSNSASGAVVLFSCARAAAQPSSIKHRLSSKRRCFIVISYELKKLFHQEVKTACSELAKERINVISRDANRLTELPVATMAGKDELASLARENAERRIVEFVIAIHMLEIEHPRVEGERSFHVAASNGWDNCINLLLRARWPNPTA